MSRNLNESIDNVIKLLSESAEFLDSHSIDLEEVPLNDQGIMANATINFDLYVDRGMRGDYITPDDPANYEVVDPYVTDLIAFDTTGDEIESSSPEELQQWHAKVIQYFQQKAAESDILQSLDQY